MATYTKETALFDTGAIGNDIQDASETASKYISTDSTGIMIYDGESGQQTPSSPDPATNNVFIDDNSLDIRKGPNVLASFGETVIIGQEGSSQITISGTSFEGTTDKGVSSFGIYGNGSSISSEKNYTNWIGLTQGESKTLRLSYTLTDLSDGSNYRLLFYRNDTTGTFLDAETFAKGATGTWTSQMSVTSGVTLRCTYNKSTNVLELTQTGGGSTKYYYKITVRYTTTVQCPYYIFGTRAAGSSNGGYSFSSGRNITASGPYSHAEGSNTTASGDQSHAEGFSTTASGWYSHSEGYRAVAEDDAAHAEGRDTVASGEYSHAQNCFSIASGYYSHAQNYYSVATENSQTVIGKYNKATVTGTGESKTYSDVGDYAFIIGNGTSDTTEGRSNALTVDWDGRVECGDYSGSFKSIFDIFYPVGSYYETSDTSFDPNVAWGGTWVKDSAGKVTVAQDTSDTSFDTIGETGGSKYIQAHTHSFTQPTITSYYNNNVSYGSGSASRPYTGGGHTTTGWNKATGGAVGAVSGATTGSAGNLQPYIVVNRWHRTA